jgi:hypothetical protein
MTDVTNRTIGGFIQSNQVGLGGLNQDGQALLGAIAASLGMTPESFYANHVSSAYRSPSENRAVGGARNSQHMNAIAIDVRGLTPEQREVATRAAVRAGAGGIGLYPSGAMHFDTRPTVNGRVTTWGANYRASSTPGWLSGIVRDVGKATQEAGGFLQGIGSFLGGQFQRDAQAAAQNAGLREGVQASTPAAWSPPAMDPSQPVMGLNPFGNIGPMNLEPYGPQVGPNVGFQDVQGFAARNPAFSAAMDAPFSPALDYGMPQDDSRFSFDGFAPSSPAVSWGDIQTAQQAMQVSPSAFQAAPNISLDYSSLAAPADASRFSMDGFAPSAPAMTSLQSIGIQDPLASFSPAPNISLDYSSIAPASRTASVGNEDTMAFAPGEVTPAGVQAIQSVSPSPEQTAAPTATPSVSSPQVAATGPQSYANPISGLNTALPTTASLAPPAPAVTGGVLRSGQQMPAMSAPMSFGTPPATPAYAPGALLSSFSPQTAAQSFAPGIAGSLITNAQNMGFAVPEAGYAYGYSPFSPGGLALMTQQQLTPTTGWDPSIPASGPGIFGAFQAATTPAIGNWDNQGQGFGNVYGDFGSLAGLGFNSMNGLDGFGGGGSWSDPGSQLGGSLY